MPLPRKTVRVIAPKLCNYTHSHDLRLDSGSTLRLDSGRPRADPARLCGLTPAAPGPTPACLRRNYDLFAAHYNSSDATLTVLPPLRFEL